MTPNKKVKKRGKKKVCNHDFEIEQCESCGHTSEVCLKCWKGRCSEREELKKDF